MKMLQARSRLIIIGVIAAAETGVLSSSAQATIIESSRWHMGESGTVVGTFAQDSLNADGAFNHFNNANQVSYLSATPPALTGSTDYMHTTGSADGSGQWIFTGGTAQTVPTTNWGVEFWVRHTNLASIPTNGNYDNVISMNGAHPGALVIQAARTTGNVFFDVNRSGQANMIFPRNATTQVSENVWYNLALVDIGDTIHFYVNGVLAGTAAQGTAAANGQIHLGIQPSTGGQNFVGDYDELRFFTFAEGQFSVQDLYINNLVPEPSSLAMLLFGSIGLWLMRRNRTA